MDTPNETETTLLDGFEIVVPVPRDVARATAVPSAKKAFSTSVTDINTLDDINRVWMELYDSYKEWRQKSWNVLIQKYQVDEFWSQENARQWDLSWVLYWRLTIRQCHLQHFYSIEDRSHIESQPIRPTTRFRGLWQRLVNPQAERRRRLEEEEEKLCQEANAAIDAELARLVLADS